MKKVIILIFIVTFLNSCVRSLYPLIENEKEMIFKKELLGTWKNKDGEEYLIDTLKDHNGQYYRIKGIVEKNNTSTSAEKFSDTSYFIAMLANIKGNYVMDCSADMEHIQQKKLGESASNSLLPIHFFIKVFNIERNSIDLSALDNDKLAMLLKQKKFNIRHEVINKNEILLTEKSKMLQQKLMELEKFSAVYGEKNRLIRMK